MTKEKFEQLAAYNRWASGGSAQVALERVTVNGNAFGIAADGTNSTAGHQYDDC
jgi:hypothetical protein